MKKYMKDRMFLIFLEDYLSAVREQNAVVAPHTAVHIAVDRTRKAITEFESGPGLE